MGKGRLGSRSWLWWSACGFGLESVLNEYLLLGHPPGGMVFDAQLTVTTVAALGVRS
jgi:hypothetical protein